MFNLVTSSTLQTPKYSYFLQRANELANKYNGTIPPEFTCDHTFVNEWNDAKKKPVNISEYITEGNVDMLIPP